MKLSIYRIIYSRYIFFFFLENSVFFGDAKMIVRYWSKQVVVLFFYVIKDYSDQVGETDLMFLFYDYFVGW